MCEGELVCLGPSENYVLPSFEITVSCQHVAPSAFLPLPPSWTVPPSLAPSPLILMEKELRKWAMILAYLQKSLRVHCLAAQRLQRPGQRYIYRKY